MAKKATQRKPVPAREAVRRPSPSEQKALDRKKVLASKKADPVKDASYPPKDTKREVKKLAEERKKEEKAAPKPPVALDDVPDLADCLPEMIEEFKTLKAERAVIDARLEELGPTIVSMLEAVGQRAIYTDEWQITRATNTTVSISKEKLVELGVDPAIITEATVRKETRPFAKLTLRGEKEEGKDL